LDVVRELYKKGVVKFGQFVLKSGQKSPIYLDLRVVPSYPQLFAALIDLASERFSTLGADGVVGIATGGLVWSSVIAYKTRLPHFYVREEKKAHGTSSLLEGGDPSTLKSPVVVDDVATTGSSILSAVQALKSAGLKPQNALVVVDREQGAASRLIEEGIKLSSCFTLTEILEGLRQEVGEKELEEVLKWHNEQKRDGRTET